MKVKALLNTLAKILGHTKVKTPFDALGYVETEALVDALAATYA